MRIYRWLILVVLVCCGKLSPISAAEQRTWVDSTGKHRIEAEFVKLDGQQVTLRNSAGKLITLSLARLSADDQKFLREQTASAPTAPPEARPTVAGNPAAAKPIAKRMYLALIDDKLDDVKPLLTPTAQANWEAARTLLEGIEIPDSRQSVLVRSAKANGDTADVSVSIKVRGKFLKHTVQLHWTDKQWQIAALILDGEDAEPMNFETGTGAREANSATASRRRADREEVEQEEEPEEEDE